MTNANFTQSEIGKAVKLAVTQLATNLDSKAGGLPPPTPPRVTALPPLSGLVADVSGNEIVINAGTKSGVKVGDILTVCHVDRIILDPQTGKPIRTIESLLGTLTVSSADADSAAGQFKGAGKPGVGDRVKQ
jgi:hypothetical protein